MEPNSPKKIQFAVPVFQSQLDPEASEQIRKRRPTPASLVILNEHSPPEIDEKRMNSTNEENVSPKQRKQSVFTAPAMKGTVQTMSCLYTDSQISSSMSQHIAAENTNPFIKPRRKDTPYYPEVPLIPAVKQIKEENNSPFLEEEEDAEDEEEECDH
ncbi:hypothetical protein GDO86_016961 [Hymenochirus boettgeri]|uniref:Protein phosphatase 1 regulatory subunit 1C n=1 Tax=Hymenochirus boettgeri TaxID=247094 RepID=A0A8T2IKL7_9PIPI|nr:hypothetical protein GDO86_016961 [Hymenochirus boettgeri]